MTDAVAAATRIVAYARHGRELQARHDTPRDTVLEKGFDMGKHEERNAPSSPACSMHEFADELLPRPAGNWLDWPAVQAFRKEKRAELTT